MNKLTCLFLTLLISFHSFADDNMVAKVIILRGQVKAKLPSGNIVDVTNDMQIPEGATLQTADKSFVKLLFIDKSQMNLGPSSQMAITAFPKKEAGIITLVKGQIRSQVTKDYMEMDDKSKSKLYIKTNTAAMGIRGTDFQVNFNPLNQNTALITFEGKVVMAHIERSFREERFDQKNLEKVVSSDKAVLVEKGMVSAVNLNVSERAMVPTLLGAKQIEALKENETGVKENSLSDETKKQFRNPIPPGADGIQFSNTPDIEKQVAKLTGEEGLKSIKEATKEQSSKEVVKTEATGFFDSKTGAYKLPAGSVIDLSTVNIIPPPANAVFDPNSKTFIVPETFGKIDKVTGEYKAPEGLKLGNDGKFSVVDPDAYMKSQAIKKDDSTKSEGDKKTDQGNQPNSANMPPPSDGRSPASMTGTNFAPTSGMIMPPTIFAAVPGMTQFVDQFAVNKPIIPITSTMTEAQKALVQDKITQTQVTQETQSNLGTNNPNTNVRIIFNSN